MRKKQLLERASREMLHFSGGNRNEIIRIVVNYDGGVSRAIKWVFLRLFRRVTHFAKYVPNADTLIRFERKNILLFGTLSGSK